MPTPNVCFTRPELIELLPLYNLIRDAIAGEPTVKKAKTKYLPMPNAEDLSPENKARYEAYLARAVFYAVTRRTLYGLLGQVFLREPVIKVPSFLNQIVINATGSGINLIQLAKKAEAINLSFSRGGILTDYPATEEGKAASKADLENGKIRPTLYVYNPQEIINWRVTDRGAEEILSLIVLYESYTVEDDGFEMKNSHQFRVLRLDEGGEVVVELWREPQERKADGKAIPKSGNFLQHKVFLPKDASGKRLTEIPFTFFGSENNDPIPDNPIFYDLASLNMAHYRNSADYEETCYVVGQATPVATGLTEEWVKNVLKGVLSFGSRGGIPLPEGATIQLLQAEANSMSKEAMDTKERQMVALGAKLVEQKEVERTATEAKLESASEGSVLATATKNVSAAFTFALKWAARFVGVPETGIEFELNTDFDISNLSPDERKQVVEEWQKNAITFEEMRTVLRKAGVATEKDDVAKEKIKQDTIEAMGLLQVENTPGDQSSQTA